MLILYLKFLFLTNSPSSDDLRQTYYQENEGIYLLKDDTIKLLFGIDDDTNPGKEQHEQIQKKYNEENNEIELYDDNGIIICFKNEENMNTLKERNEQSLISNFISQQKKRLCIFFCNFLFDTLVIYIKIKYRLMFNTHPYMKDQYDNVFEYAKTLKYLLFNERSEFSKFFGNLDQFCDVLEDEKTISDEKSKELEERQKILEKIHYKISNERKLENLIKKIA